MRVSPIVRSNFLKMWKNPDFVNNVNNAETTVDYKLDYEMLFDEESDKFALTFFDKNAITPSSDAPQFSFACPLCSRLARSPEMAYDRYNNDISIEPQSFVKETVHHVPTVPSLYKPPPCALPVRKLFGGRNLKFALCIEPDPTEVRIRKQEAGEDRYGDREVRVGPRVRWGRRAGCPRTLSIWTLGRGTMMNLVPHFGCRVIDPGFWF